MNEIFELIKSDFSSLWRIEMMGETAKIGVPDQTCVDHDNGICVYVSRQGDEWVISDGGDLSNPSVHDDRSVVVWAMDKYKVRVTMNASGCAILYVKTNRQDLISARVFDMIHFIQTVCICRRHDQECGNND